MAGKLDGKVALVTGASSGIGEATALALVVEGAKVAISARRSDRLSELLKRITDNGGKALPIEGDVEDEEQANAMVKKTHDEFGRLDILVNNAGVMLLGQIEGAKTEEWRQMVNTNVLGLMYATHAALPIFRQQGSGHIVNISSVAGRTARAGSGVYNATKWGVVAFSEALRQEVYKDNIRITVIEPGMVATELTNHITDQKAIEGIKQMRQSLTPLESEDIASAIAYAVTQPEHVSINEMLIRPTKQAN